MAKKRIRDRSTRTYSNTDVKEITPVQGPVLSTEQPAPTAQVMTRAEINQQYVVMYPGMIANMLKTLPNAFDDLTCQYGLEIYRRLAEDPEISASLNVLKIAATAQRCSIIPAETFTKAREDKARKIAEFVSYAINNMETPMSLVLERLCTALRDGSAIAEIIYSTKDVGKYKGRRVLTDIKTVPIDNCLYAVDSFANVVGVVPKYNGTTAYPINTVIPYSSDKTPVDLKGVVARSHFVIFTWGGEGKPQGESILHAAYQPWYMKTQIMHLWLDWFGKHVMPWIWGTVPANAMKFCDEKGNPTTPTKWLAEAIVKMKNNSVGAFPAGTNIHIDQVTAVNGIFTEALDYLDRAILRSILNQHLATGEGQHQTRAAAEVHKDTLSLYVIQIKRRLAETIKRDVFRDLVLSNFGQDAEDLIPDLDLGEGDGFPTSFDEIMEFIKAVPAEIIDWEALRRKFSLPIDSEAVSEMLESEDSPEPPEPQADNLADDDSQESETVPTESQQPENPEAPAEQSIKEKALSLLQKLIRRKPTPMGGG